MRLTVSEDPAPVSVLDARTLVRPPRVATLLVHNPRRSVLDMLRNDVSPWDWSTAVTGTPVMHRVGALAGGVLVALALVEQPVGHIARMQVVVSESHRGRGFGRTVLHAAATHSLNAGLVPFCRVPTHDAAARALAHGAGFVSFAQSLTFRVASMRHAHAHSAR